jgi:hypothetical protein
LETPLEKIKKAEHLITQNIESFPSNHFIAEIHYLSAMKPFETMQRL